MYINYNTVGGREYATLATSVRTGTKVGKSDRIYLGRVIDKEKGIYKSRDRGIFTYDLKTDTYGTVPLDYIEPKEQRQTKYPRRPVLSVSFGDIYLLNQFIRKSGFSKAVDAIGFRNPDTLYALLSYYLLCPLSNCHAEDWWELTYAKYLYPKAQMSSQGLSDALKDLGSEDAKRRYFKEYFSFIEHSTDKKHADENGIDDGILIDSTGLPNTAHLSVTAVSNHNHVISEEIRLVYVIQQKTGMPLFFRYVAGNVVDVSTITRTIAELKANGINTKFAILDAGYYTGVNADALLDAGISFISRMKCNFKVYKQVVS
ncbi:MAG: transposase, partial [Clostridiales bacterium]|nr:transposase [Clostridiales bacterium]